VLKSCATSMQARFNAFARFACHTATRLVFAFFMAQKRRRATRQTAKECCLTTFRAARGPALDLKWAQAGPVLLRQPQETQVPQSGPDLRCYSSSSSFQSSNWTSFRHNFEAGRGALRRRAPHGSNPPQEPETVSFIKPVVLTTTNRERCSTIMSIILPPPIGSS